MARSPALMLAGSVVCTGLVLTEFGSSGNHRASSGARLPPAETEPAQPEIRKPADPLLGPTRRRPESSSSAEAQSPLRDVRLTGVVIGPDLRIAIFAVNGTNPLVLSEGEALRDWRIDSISRARVVLRGPAGDMALAPKPDANLVRQPPSPAVQSGQIEAGIPSGAAMAGATWQPMAMTPVAVGNIPVPTPIPTQVYRYYSPEYYTGSDQYYSPYNDYPYLSPYLYLAYALPTNVGFGFGFFHHHGIHHSGFRRATFHGGGPGRRH